MRSNMKSGGFRIRLVKAKDHGFVYQTFQVVGYLAGARIRKKFKSREAALGELHRLEVEATNAVSDTRAINTRLTVRQISAAETLFSLTPDPLAAVQWYLANFRPALAEMPIETARDAFISERTPHISTSALRDYVRTLKGLCGMYPARAVHAFTATEVETFLKAKASGPKRHNNMRGDLHAFFNFCMSPARKWASGNPVVGTTKFKIARGIPEIISAEKAAAVMEYVESHKGGDRCDHPAGFLAPYFALCLFAGIRPSVSGGEISRLGTSPDLERLIDTKLGVIRITPEISKVGAVRQVKIQPNLAAWLARYPVKDFPIMVPNMLEKVSHVRKRFALTDDVLRHTFISAHVNRFQSLGAAALEAGNSEAMIRKHYLNMMSDADADAFWGILPKNCGK